MDQSTSEVRMKNWLTIAKQCQNRPSGQSAGQCLADLYRLCFSCNMTERYKLRRN